MAPYSGWMRAALVVWLAGACSGDDDAGPDEPGAGGAGASSGAAATGGNGGGGAGRGGAAGEGTGGGSGASGTSNGGAGGMGSEPPACGSSNAGGSRVKLKLAVTAEGDERVLGFHDTELDIDCAYRRVAEGVGRCLPESIRTYTVGSPGVYFRDAACTGTPVHQFDDEGCPAEYLLVHAPDAGDVCAEAQPRLFARGAAVDASAAATLYALVGDACQSATLQPPAPLFERGEEQDLASYAAGQLGTWASAGGLAVEGYLGEDGSRDADGFLDTARDERCSPVRLEDGELHCVVVGRVSTRFGDAACEHPLLTSYDPCDQREPPSFGIIESETVCESYALYRVLAPYTATTDFDALPTCHEEVLPEGDGFERYTTEPADPAEMIGVEKLADPDDGGRLQRQHFRNADGACFVAGVRDTELDSECSIDTAKDGKLRCVPLDSSYWLTTLYSDAACTTEALYATGDDCGEHTPFAVRRIEMGCERRLEAWRVMPEPIASADLPPLYTLRSGECERAVFSSGSTHFRVGEELAPEAMMEATIELR
jgi:hypothetical protein